MRSLFIAAVVLLAKPSFADKDKQCPAGVLLDENLVNPVGIKSYIAGHNQIKSVEDLVCCLPKVYRRHYVIAHSSIAAQSSDPQGPRILMFNIKSNDLGTPLNPMQAVLSFNGGSTNLNNPNNVELMYNNHSRGEVEFFDIDFSSGNPHMSERNPQACIQCHGTNGKVGIGGPHPNFDPFGSWRRFVNGIGTCTPQERHLVKAINLAVNEAMKTNSRYRCLDSQEIELLGQIDDFIGDLNDRRLAQIVKSSTPNYGKFKYAILGSLICLRKGAPIFPRDWLPKEVLMSIRDENFLQTSVRSSTDLKETLIAGLHQQWESGQKNEEKLNLAAVAIESKKRNPDFAFALSMNSVHCFSEKEVANIAAPVANNLGGPELFDKFKIDSALRAARNGVPFSPALRYLIEGRGVDMGNWSTDPTDGDYLRNPKFLAAQLFALEPQGSPLKKIEIEFRAATDSPAFDVPIDLERYREACANLARLSLAAFKDESSPSADPKQKEVTH